MREKREEGKEKKGKERDGMDGRKHSQKQMSVYSFEMVHLIHTNNGVDTHYERCSVLVAALSDARKKCKSFHG